MAKREIVAVTTVIALILLSIAVLFALPESYLNYIARFQNLITGVIAGTSAVGASYFLLISARQNREAEEEKLEYERRTNRAVHACILAAATQRLIAQMLNHQAKKGTKKIKIHMPDEYTDPDIIRHLPPETRFNLASAINHLRTFDGYYFGSTPQDRAEVVNNLLTVIAYLNTLAYELILQSDEYRGEDGYTSWADESAEKYREEALRIIEISSKNHQSDPSDDAEQ